MKRTSFLKPFLLVLLILAFASAAFALDFSTELVESGDYFGYAKDAVCGPDGRIHVSYMNNAGSNDSTSGDVKYAVYDGSTWVVETVIAPGDYLSSNTSIALDSGGQPHIVYNYTCGANEHYQDLDHAWWDGSQWQTETVLDGDSLSYRPGHPSLAISDSNVANVVFHVSRQMYWARKQLPSGSGSVEMIEGATGSHTSMALDSSGYPHVSYRKGGCTSDSLGYSYYDGSSWVHEEVVSADSWGTCMAFDPNGIPCISFVDADGRSEQVGAQTLYFAYKEGSDWEVESVDQDGTIMWEFTSLNFASDGTPFIAYIDEEFEPNTLKVAQRNSGGGWTVTEVDEAGAQSCQLQNTSLVVDNQNYVHTFYNSYNDSEGIDADINHAVADTGIVVDDVTDGSSGGGCNSMALVPFSLLLLTPLAFLLKK